MSEKSLLQSVQEDLNKAKKESAKAKLKTMFEDRIKAKTALEGIEDNIVTLLVSVGETEDGVRAMLAAD